MIFRSVIKLPLLIALAAPTARADDAVRLDRALRVLRNRVFAAADTPENHMFLAGSVIGILGGIVTTIAGVGLVAVQPPIPRWAYRFTAVSALLTAGAAATARVGLHNMRYNPTPPPPPGPAEHYRSTEGLREFMRLSPAQQRRLAADNPDFAAFLIEVAEAYQRVADAQRPPGGRR